MTTTSVTKPDLADTMARTAGITKTQATEALDAALNAIAYHVAEGNKVTLHNFGTFEARTRSARTGRNPRTGAVVQIPEHRSPVFKPFSAFKDTVQN